MESATVILSIVLALVTCGVYLMVARQDSNNIQSTDEFFLGRKSLKAKSVFGTFYASGMSLATVFVAYMQLAPFLGLSLIWAAVFYAAGHLLLLLLINRISDATKGNNTIHGYIGTAFQSERMRIAASFATVVGFLGIFSTELIVGSMVFENLIESEIGFWAIFVLFIAVVLGYSIMGGFKSVVRTDFIQAVGIIFVCVFLVYVAFELGEQSNVGLIPDKLVSSVYLPPLLLLNFFLINVLFPIVDMSAWQKIAGAESKSVAKKGVITAVFMFLITWLCILFASLALTEYSQLDSSGGLTSILIKVGSIGWVHAILSALAFAALLAAMISTADSFLIATGQSLSMDVFSFKYFSQRDRNLSERMEMKIVNKSRLYMLSFALLSLLICLALKRAGFGIADLIFAVYGSALALLPTVVAALFFRKKNFLYSLEPFLFGSIVIGVSIGWIYGFLAVQYKSLEGFSLSFISIFEPVMGPASAYNAPTVSFLAATIVTLFGLVFVRVNNSFDKDIDYA